MFFFLWDLQFLSDLWTFYSFIKNRKERKDFSAEKNVKIVPFFWKERMPNPAKNTFLPNPNLPHASLGKFG